MLSVYVSQSCLTNLQALLQEQSGICAHKGPAFERVWPKNQVCNQCTHDANVTKLDVPAEKDTKK